MYIKANIEIEKVKNGNSISKNAIANYTKVRDKSTEFMMKKIDNQVLSYLKQIKQDNMQRIRREQHKQYIEKSREWQLEKIINNRLQNLLYSINQDIITEYSMKKGYKNRVYFYNQTKRARREEALKNRDVGLINWEEK